MIATCGWGGAPSGGVEALLGLETLPGVDDGSGGGAGSLDLEMAWGTDLSGWRHGTGGEAGAGLRWTGNCSGRCTEATRDDPPGSAQRR